MVKKNKISDWYKEKIEQEHTSPPVEVWENIENELDIDQVWERVSRRLDSINLFSKIKRITYYTVAAISMLLLIDYIVSNRSAKVSMEQEPLSSGNAQDKPDDVNQFAPEQNKSVIDTIPPGHQKIEETPTVSRIEKSATLPKINKISSEKIYSDIPDYLPGETVGKDTKSESGLVLIGDEEKITPVAAINVGPLAESGDKFFLLYPSFNQDLAPKPDERNIIYRGFYFGLSTHVRNTWLLNNTTFRGLTRSDLTTTVPDFGKSLVLVAGTNLREKFTFQFEGALIDEGGQKYLQYIHGKYVSRVIDLDYLTFNILLKYSRSHLWAGKTPVSGNFIVGSYAGYLKSANEIIDAESENIRYDYNKIDFGLIMGYEYDFHITRRFTISSGIRFNVGFPNVFAGNDLIPSTFNKTNTASANLVIGVKYYMPRK